MEKAQFTKREKFTKSLKLEALPEDATKEAIKTQMLLEMNQKMLDDAKELERYIDAVLVNIMNKGLSNFCATNFDMNALYLAYMNATTDRKEYTEKVEELKSAAVKCVTDNLPEGMKKISDINSASFIKDIMPNLIEASDLSAAEKEKGTRLIEEMSSCGSLMNKFLTTRVTAVATWMPDRVAENFEIFADNALQIRKFMSDALKEISILLVDFPEFTSMESIDYYNYCISAQDIAGYNRIISGIQDENGVIKKGYNQFITELNTAHKHDPNYNGDFFRTLKPLHQQILMPKKKMFTIEKINNDDELRNLLADVDEKMSKKSLFMIVEHLKTADVNGIVVDGNSLHDISHLVYGDHRRILNVFKESLSVEIEGKLQDAKKKSEIKKLEDALESASTTVESKTYTMDEVNTAMGEDVFGKYIERLIGLYRNTISTYVDLKENRILGNRKIFGRKEAKNLVKNYMDALLKFRSTVMNVIPKKNDDRQDILFYERLDNLCKNFPICVKAYNMCRNYLTAAPKDLAMENPMFFGQPLMLAGTWWKDTDPKMKAGICGIMEKDGKYYYVVKSPTAKPLTFPLTDEKTGYKMLSYRKGQDANKMFAKIVFNKDVKRAFDTTDVDSIKHPLVAGLIVTREHYKYYKEKTYSLDSVRKKKVTEEERRYALAVMIDFYKSVIPLYASTSCFHFDLKPTEEYNDIGLFMEDCNRFMASGEWLNLDRTYVDKAVASEQLLSFLITNRNMYKDDNVKTTYAKTFLYMMSEDNLKNMNFRLNAKPMITYRPACLPLEITHPKGSILLNRYDSKGNRIPNHAYGELLDYYNGRRKESNLSKDAQNEMPYCITKVADYDIAKNYHYMVDKFFISLSYNVNADISDRERNTISEEVYESMKHGFKMLSVVRGTTDMLYYILYDEDGNIITKKSLNVIGNTDYREILSMMTKENKNAMSDNWTAPEKVAKIKQSYVDFAIAEILKVAVQNEAVVVIEKLNDKFKDKMSLIDNQVYKIFETRLKNRLLDYRTKDAPMGMPGSISNPMQLGKNTLGSPMQNGILFEINSGYTKNMDCNTGFVDLFNWNNCNTIAAKRRFLKQFDSIKISGKIIEFTFDYLNFATKNTVSTDALNRTVWTIYTGKPRTEYDHEKGIYILNKAPAEDVISSFSDKFLDLTKAELTNKQVKELFDLFMHTVKQTTVKRCAGNKKEYYSSPVAETDLNAFSVAENTSRNLADKMVFILDTVEDDSDFTTGWLNYKTA